MVSALEIANADAQDRAYVASILDKFPTRWAYGFARKYSCIVKKSRREANLYLMDRIDSIKSNPIGLNASDDDIQALAKEKAVHYLSYLNSGTHHIAESAHKVVKSFKNQAGRADCVTLKDRCEQSVIELVKMNVIPPKIDDDLTPFVARLSDVKWWRRSLRVAINRHVEAEAIKAGFVGFRVNYASNEMVERRRQQNRRNANLMEMVEAVNDSGFKTTLAKLSEAGTSNPELRKNELMVRLRGLEEEAKRKGLVCEFLTITCPSKYHATTTAGNKKRISNRKYQDFTPKEAQQYLTKTWAKIRAEFGRREITPVGFRVAEPHRDGCPHWHLLVFVERNQAEEMWRVVRHYAYKEEHQELRTQNAKSARFDRKRIDLNEGSAVAYIAKYIAKNVSMSGLEDFENHEGGSAADGLERSVAWASCWGVRQFQEFGTNKITVWRELRKLRKAEGLPEVVAVLWKTADAGEYGQFIREVAKRNIEIVREKEKEKPLYGRKIEPDDKGVFRKVVGQVSALITGIFNKYGEEVAGAISGIRVDGVGVVTRFNTWIFTYKSMNASRSLGLV